MQLDKSWLSPIGITSLRKLVQQEIKHVHKNIGSISWLTIFYFENGSVPTFSLPSLGLFDFIYYSNGQNYQTIKSIKRLFLLVVKKVRAIDQQRFLKPHFVANA